MNASLNIESPIGQNRRQFLAGTGLNLGAMALASLLRGDESAATHLAPKAKRVIYLFMHGGPSQLDLFDDTSQEPAEHAW